MEDILGYKIIKVCNFGDLCAAGISDMVPKTHCKFVNANFCEGSALVPCEL